MSLSPGGCNVDPCINLSPGDAFTALVCGGQQSNHWLSDDHIMAAKMQCKMHCLQAQTTMSIE
jgi:hypothetical protein